MKQYNYNRNSGEIIMCRNIYYIILSVFSIVSIATASDDPPPFKKTKYTVPTVYGIPQTLHSGFQNLRLTEHDYMRETANHIRHRLCVSLRQEVPDDLLLGNGFEAKEMSDMDLAGAYIRLGQRLRTSELENRPHLAALSFFRAGFLYARKAIEFQNEVVIDATVQELGVDGAVDLTSITTHCDYLISAAQCYFWSYCNEDIAHRKATLRRLAQNYFSKTLDAVRQISFEQTNMRYINMIMQKMESCTRRLNE